MIDVTTETFDRDVIERSHELPVVVDFWAAWCAPCRMLGPAIESEVEKRAGQIELAKLDVDAEQAIAGRYGIQSIPTVAVFRDGEVAPASSAPIPPRRSATSSTSRCSRRRASPRPRQPPEKQRTARPVRGRAVRAVLPSQCATGFGGVSLGQTNSGRMSPTSR